MDAFTVTAMTVERGIALDDKGMLAVGESGRGRSLTTLRPAPGWTVTDGRVVSTGAGDVLVLIRDCSGYRGAWWIRAARPLECWDETQRIRETYPAAYPDTHAEARDAAQTARDARWPTVTDLGAIPGVKVIARGARAQGIAGAMGGGPEYLLRLRPGTALEICRSGRLYGGVQYVRVEVLADGRVATSDCDATAAERAASRRAAE